MAVDEDLLNYHQKRATAILGHLPEDDREAVGHWLRLSGQRAFERGHLDGLAQARTEMTLLGAFVGALVGLIPLTWLMWPWPWQPPTCASEIAQVEADCEDRVAESSAACDGRLRKPLAWGDRTHNVQFAELPQGYTCVRPTNSIDMYCYPHMEGP